jgi:hypothetical protein
MKATHSGLHHLCFCLFIGLIAACAPARDEEDWLPQPTPYVANSTEGLPVIDCSHCEAATSQHCDRVGTYSLWAIGGLYSPRVAEHRCFPTDDGDQCAMEWTITVSRLDEPQFLRGSSALRSGDMFAAVETQNSAGVRPMNIPRGRNLLIGVPAGGDLLRSSERGRELCAKVGDGVKG